MKTCLVSLVAPLALAHSVGAHSHDAVLAPDVLSLINPLIGTVNGGHVFPGATLPYGMAKPGADTNGETQGGFDSNAVLVTGFSHMHDSGTGGGSSFGNFPIFPIANCPTSAIADCQLSRDTRSQFFNQSSVQASPGYFALSLFSGVHAEMTTSNKTALYRFQFPASTKQPMIIAALEDLGNSYRNGGISVNRTSGQVQASGEFTPSFGSGSYKVYTCMDFNGAPIADVDRYHSFGNGNVKGGNGKQGGAYVRFQRPADGTISVRVGMSFISTAQACRTAAAEIPQFQFDKVRQTAQQAWRNTLSTIEITPGVASLDLQKTFWSGIYRAMISPQDYTGDNPLWTSAEPYYDSFYCIWDSFRAQHPLLTLVDPVSQTKMVRTLIDVYRHLGKLPDCRMSLDKGFTQGGSNADIVLADALLKGLSKGIDWATAYEAVVSDAEVEPANWDIEGRGGLVSWKTKGYIPKDDKDTNGTGLPTRCVSRTAEYAYDDFCIAQMAQRLGHADDAVKYFNRSSNWLNLFKRDQNSSIAGADTGFTGFLQPKWANGSWAYQDPIFCSPLLEPNACYLNANGHDTYEGSAWLYTFFVPGDMARLISTLGGPEAFVKRLDFFHESGLLYIGDEQSFLTVYLYHYAGRPDLSAKRARAYIPAAFNATISGIPGNDDSGAMGSFAALTMMGIFPNPGQDVYFLTPPFFEQVRLRNAETGKVAVIKALGFDGGKQGKYITSATLNGKPWTQNWIRHDFFRDGGVLELQLASQENPGWGKQGPPSLSTGL